MKQLENDSVHKKIMQTKNAFVENDDFDPEKSMEAAVDKQMSMCSRAVMSGCSSAYHVNSNEK